MSHPLRRLLPIVAERRATFVWTTVANLLVHLGILTLALLTAYLASIAAGSSDRALTGFGLLVGAVAILIATATWRESWVGHDLAYGLITILRARLFRSLRDSLPDRAGRRRTGDFVSVAFTDIDALEWLYAHTVAQSLTAVVVLAVTTITSLLISPWLLVVTLPLLVATAAIPWTFIRSNERHGAELARQKATLNADLIDTVQGIRELTAAGALGRQRSRLAGRTRHLTDVQARIASRSGLERALADLLLSLGAVGALLVTLHPDTAIDPVLAPVALVLSTAALGPIAQLSDLLRHAGTLLASGRRVVDVFDRAQSVQPAKLSRQLPALSRTGLEFEAVDFSYSDETPPALSGVSFAVRPGERVALVGPSGAGKTTCANLALRMWDPDHGRITLDGTPLNRLSDHDLRTAISAVQQDPLLLHGTVESNIRLGRPDASDAEIADAATRAGILTPEARFADGLDTEIGEGGAGISGGQRARVAVARALLMQPRVLIFDEATAHLDDTADATISDMLAALDGYAILVIAHRRSTIARCDRIVRLHAGHVPSGTTD